ncbi:MULTISPECIES: hypothetical protein [Sphingobacterium]|uniref:DoxX family protein n=1 Tax=Sphingobacterium litopenaei TaxID=2763500 RepID=A0ABR7YHF3_9SPHI|nr:MULTISPECIES: hypothetical protein [Sphingobacterium]MBD1430752.1 hypothetical protein [Sphingobacterium litopenaei]NGM74053.1 hypothetical protein [Sphingobacterium sp. SGL-16]
MNNQLYWTTTNKVLFRFAFIFIICFIIVFNNEAYPCFNVLTKPITSLFHDFTPWFAKNILHYTYDYTIFSNGSGDTSYDWVTLSILILLGVLGSVLWSLIDRNRKEYNHLYYWLTVLIRYYIAFMLFNYGAIKLLHAQMPPPSLNRLMQPLHEFSPMGLAWTYLGFSKGYNIFMGIVEISALLLLFRRTVTIVALITMATSINIMTVNYFFDVPVKLVSTALFLLSLFLLLPNIKTLYAFFILGKPAEIRTIDKTEYSKPWIKKGLIALKVIVIIVFAVTQYFSLTNTQKMIADYFKKSTINGIFKVDRQGKSFKSIPNEWNYIIFEFEGTAVIRDTNYQKGYQQFLLDEKTKEITINNFKLNYSIQKNGDIILTKSFTEGTEEIKLIKQNKEDMELIKRGFNLIQEYPYNR